MAKQVVINGFPFSQFSVKTTLPIRSITKRENVWMNFHFQYSFYEPNILQTFLTSFLSYSSMVIRDLTLRSAASFGSFHLIRLLYDEYMFYLVEHRVAQATGETPIAVMGEVSSQIFKWSLFLCTACVF